MLRQLGLRVLSAAQVNLVWPIANNFGVEADLSVRWWSTRKQPFLLDWLVQ